MNAKSFWCTSDTYNLKGTVSLRVALCNLEVIKSIQGGTIPCLEVLCPFKLCKMDLEMISVTFL